MWAPADPAYFAIPVILFIGGTDDPDGPTDSFETLVSSPAWLNDHLADIQADDPTETDGLTGLPYRTGRGLWLMPRWDHAVFQRDLDALFLTAAGPDWPTVANRLSRHLEWEYEDEAIDRGSPKFE